jgi:D-alanine-D-alanine ligase-like ATP-grasp enzyme
VGTPVLLEEVVRGDDLRIVVIDHQLVAAAVRCPPRVHGDGQHSIEALIVQQSQRRQAETHGESQIPLDEETRRAVNEAGYALGDVLPAGQPLQVRGAANLHQGGTIHDVTAQLHPTLAEVACRASRALDIPVVGVDLIVRSVREPDYWILEANERPGLANHEPQPTAQRFVDLLFPETKR